MNIGAEKSSSTSRNLTQSQVVGELGELVRDLQELLEGYGPTWYTADMSSRITETLAMLVPPRNTAECHTLAGLVYATPHSGELPE